MAQYRPGHRPQEGRRQLEAEIGANPQPPGQPQAQPARQAAARGHHHLARQRRPQGLAQQFGQPVGQIFEAVALVAVKGHDEPKVRWVCGIESDPSGFRRSPRLAMLRQPAQGSAQSRIRQRAGGGFQHLGVAPSQRQARSPGLERRCPRRHANPRLG